MGLRSTVRPLLRPIVLARSTARELRRVLRGIPAVGRVDFGDLRRTRPLCAHYGLARGLPIDRVYIERFLEAHRADVQGRVLEIGGREYTERFGGTRVTRSDVLDIDRRNRHANIVADLTSADLLDGERYDAIILTQVLQLIFDVPAAIATLHRLLKPGGVLLATVCGISSIGSACGDDASWYWSFTPRSLQRLLLGHFDAPNIELQSHGNVLTAVMFLEGVAASELAAHEFEVQDVDYPVVVSARAVKAGPGR
jgi:SAM-dependent methyltransferase